MTGRSSAARRTPWSASSRSVTAIRRTTLNEKWIPSSTACSRWSCDLNPRRQVAAALDVVQGQGGHERGQGGGRLQFPVRGILLVPSLGSLGQMAEQDPGPLGE